MSAVIGTLKGYDQLMNLVLDEVKEAMTGASLLINPFTLSQPPHTDTHITDEDGTIRYRKLGLIVARGTLLVVISPVDGSEEIANPFIQEEE
jgi:U6 snRNA-associated Sm-like protein LSm7